MASKRRVSLKYKLLGLLITLPVISLALYLVLATHLFETDKIAYVYDSSAMASRSLGAQVRGQIESGVAALRPLLEGLDERRKKLDSASVTLFARAPQIDAVTFYSLRE